MIHTYDFLIVGGGIFGATAAVTLSQRGHTVALFDPGPLPHPQAASTDISKVVRIAYGGDAAYMTLGAACLPGWRQWNAQFGDTLYHETGVMFLTRGAMTPTSFEGQSYALLDEHGHAPERLDAATIRQRFPAWNTDVYTDGFFHAQGGYAESGRVVTTLLDWAKNLGVAIHEGTAVTQLVQENDRVQGIVAANNEVYTGGHVIVAAGAWTPRLVPDLRPMMQATGHPVFHLAAPAAELFQSPHFAVFGAAIADTGWYGFPLHPRENVVKVARHSDGLVLDPVDDERLVTSADEAALRHFLAQSLPALANAKITYTRRCLYCDTRDEHFIISQHSLLSGLTVASGGSGHAFKFAPLLGDLTADAATGTHNEWLNRFRWRLPESNTVGQEAARHHA